MIPNPKEKQSFLQTSGQDAGTQCLSRTRSVFRGHTVPLAPTADARRLFAPTAGTQCLSRLRRAHSAFRAYGGHTVPFAPTAGTQCLSRLRRAHSAFRAYGGHTVPFAPTAGTQCLSRLRRPLRKQTAKSLLSAPYGKALQKQEKPPKDRKPSFRISFEKEKH